MQQAFIIHCLSPLHAGTGQAVDLVDLPIARYAATRIPFLPGSSIKGVLRDKYTPAGSRPEKDQLNQQQKWGQFLAAFGPDVLKDDTSEHAGAVAFGDARLLALPIRSLRGTFAYVTSPLLLRLLYQDLAQAGNSPVGDSKIPKVPQVPAPDEAGERVRIPRALVTTEANTVLVHRSQQDGAGRLFLEDLDFIAEANPVVDAWATWLDARVFAGQKEIQRRFAVIDDDAMSFLWETSTQIDAHNRINDRGTVADGQLWYEENLPPETLLVGLVSASASRRRGATANATVMLKTAFPEPDSFVQFGGKASTGKGRARLLLVDLGATKEPA